MNVKQLIAAAAVFAATGSAFAAAGYTHPAEGFVSSKSRAEVKADLNQAKAAGTYAAAGSEEYAGQYDALAARDGQQPQIASRSRGEVVQELQQAQTSGNYIVGGREYSGQYIASGRPVDLTGGRHYTGAAGE